MRPAPLVLVLAALAAATARADVWKDATEGADVQRARYDEALRDGDELVAQASARGISRYVVANLVKRALAAYGEAAAAEPGEGEPYFRIGRVAYAFYLECHESRDPNFAPQSPLCDPDAPIDRARAEQVLAAYDEFEKRAPLDPRLSVTLDAGNGNLLFRRALIHTQLATRDHLEAATREYEKIMRRTSSEVADPTVPANLAETYMMLDRLDDAIDMYRYAIARGGDFSTAYGLAVALDRDDRGEQALDVIRSQGSQTPITFIAKVRAGEIFFVPQGEEDYYFALVDEAWGDDLQAIDEWKAYLQSGAHPEFQPRAKQHLDALEAKLKAHPDKRRYHWTTDDLKPSPYPP